MGRALVTANGRTRRIEIREGCRGHASASPREGHQTERQSVGRGASSQQYLKT
jgi:hypothetical protein